MKLVKQEVKILAASFSETELANIYHTAARNPLPSAMETYSRRVNDVKSNYLSDLLTLCFKVTATVRVSRMLEQHGVLKRVRNPLIIDKNICFIVHDKMEDRDDTLPFLRAAELRFLDCVVSGYTEEEASDILPQSCASLFYFSVGVNSLSKLIRQYIESNNDELSDMATQLLASYEGELPIAGKALKEALFHDTHR